MHLIYIFLIADIIEHLFMCSMACHIFFLKKCLSRYFLHFKVYFLFLLLIYKNFLYFLDNCSLSREREIMQLLLFYWVSFDFLNSVFLGSKDSIFMKYNLSFYISVIWGFYAIYLKSWVTQSHEDLNLCFHLRKDSLLWLFPLGRCYTLYQCLGSDALYQPHIK